MYLGIMSVGNATLSINWERYTLRVDGKGVVDHRVGSLMTEILTLEDGTEVEKKWSDSVEVYTKEA